MNLFLKGRKDYKWCKKKREREKSFCEECDVDIY